MKKEKQFYAELFAGRNKFPLGESLILINYENNLPVSIRCYFKPSDITYLEAIHERLDFDIIRFSTEVSEFVIKTGSTDSSIQRDPWIANRLYADIRELIEYRLVNEKLESIPDGDGARAYVTLPYLDFLEYELSWYKSQSSINMKGLKELEEKYRIDFKIPGVSECYYLPSLSTVDSDNEKDFHLKYYHTFVFEFHCRKGNKELLKDIISQTELLLRILNTLCKSRVKIDHIIVRRRFDGKPYKIQIQRNVKSKNKDETRIAVRGKEFLPLISDIYSVVLRMQPEKFHLFQIITWRLLKIRKQTDFSIEIAILHVVLQMLLESLSGKDLRIFESDKIRELFVRLGIEISKQTMQNLLEFNKYRNKAFKKISKFSLDKKFIEVRNNIIKVLALILASFLEIKRENIETFLRIFEHQYTLHVTFNEKTETV